MATVQARLPYRLNSAIEEIKNDRCQWCIILGVNSIEAHWRFKHVQLTYNRCYSLVAYLRDPETGRPAAPHPPISYLSSSLSQLTDASGAIILGQIVKKHISASNTFSSRTTDATAS